MQDNPLIVFRQQLAELCERYHVRYLYAFGSVVTNRYIPGKSDIDLIVELEEMPPEQKGEMLLNFWDELEHLLHSKVDLLTNSIIKNDYLRKSVNATKKLIYDGAGKEILI
ncbi:MAG TPA: nucleotidyltransferase domain-containing protein [Saprospiraceae bacterium]|nr:nucleotidyltransferase domain-containing protein [Saprospiraceae bacterium]